jgi:hypothetical protein
VSDATTSEARTVVTRPERNGNTPAPGTGQAANVFTGILLALILKTSLDVFFKNITNYASLGSLFEVIKANPWWYVLVSLQLGVFIFTVARFYLGVVRYHDEVPAAGETSHFALGFLGAVLIFLVFYIAALAVKHPSLFYLSLCVAFAIDCAWFAGVAKTVEMPAGVSIVWRAYIVFDIVGIILLLILQGLAWRFTVAAYTCDMVSVLALWGIGFYDLFGFLPYYRKKDKWDQNLPKLFGRVTTNP